MVTRRVFYILREDLRGGIADRWALLDIAADSRYAMISAVRLPSPYLSGGLVQHDVGARFTRIYAKGLGLYLYLPQAQQLQPGSKNSEINK
jgi:hypothetical protein